MPMEFDAQRIFPVAREALWAALVDARQLKVCIEGCERMSAVGSGAWDLLLRFPLGKATAHFRGRLLTTEVSAPSGGVFVFDGEGEPAGAMRATAHLRLEAVSAEQTQLSFRCELNFGGCLAGLGEQPVQVFIAEFFDRLARQLDSGHPATGEPAQVAPAAIGGEARALPRSVWRRISHFLSRAQASRRNSVK